MTAASAPHAVGRFVAHVRAHPHLLCSFLAGLVVAIVVPDVRGVTTRALIGWNVTAWMFLVWTGFTLLRAGPEQLEVVARRQAESAQVVLALVALAALVSFGAVINELSAAKHAGPNGAMPHVLFALSTVIVSWVLVPSLFSLSYASLYHVSDSEDGGLRFPEHCEGFKPDYSDFLYFSFTIAVASQTSDISTTNRAMRRLVLLQSVLSFVFNTTVLAFTINMAASLF